MSGYVELPTTPSRGIVAKIIITTVMLSATAGFLTPLLLGVKNKINYDDLCNYVSHVKEKNQELGESISEQTGLYHYNPVSVRFEKNDMGTYDLRFFGDSQDEVYGARYPVMKNIVYKNVSSKKIEKYAESLQNLVDYKFNDSENVAGEVLFANLKSSDLNVYGGLYSIKKLDKYQELTDEFYAALDDARTYNCTIESIGLITPYTDILIDEYDTLNTSINQTLEGNLPFTIYPDTGYSCGKFILTDISPVNKENGNNYVYVNTLQIDDAKTFYNIEGCFVVEGENLTSEEVYKKIENREYSDFYKGSKQKYKNQNTEENDFCF